jgi:hypothetical protein
LPDKNTQLFPIRQIFSKDNAKTPNLPAPLDVYAARACHIYSQYMPVVTPLPALGNTITSRW